jgi:hypothetical protein
VVVFGCRTLDWYSKALACATITKLLKLSCFVLFCCNIKRLLIENSLFYLNLGITWGQTPTKWNHYNSNHLFTVSGSYSQLELYISDDIFILGTQVLVLGLSPPIGLKCNNIDGR